MGLLKFAFDSGKQKRSLSDAVIEYMSRRRGVPKENIIRHIQEYGPELTIQEYLHPLRDAFRQAGYYGTLKSILDLRHGYNDLRGLYRMYTEAPNRQTAYHLMEHVGDLIQRESRGSPPPFDLYAALNAMRALKKLEKKIGREVWRHYVRLKH